MQITIDHLTAGAARAEGVTVIIDVFRAYTVESYAFARGIERIYPIADLDAAYALKAAHPEYLLAGERGMKQGAGFDFGNSPSQIEHLDLSGKRLIHTTSAGTQGIAAAQHADVILLGALVNARATAEYIRSLAPEKVSLICMGLENRRPTQEDTLCAAYIQAILQGTDSVFDKEKAVDLLRKGDGQRFFIPENQPYAPERDFYLCTEFDKFDFALRVEKDAEGRDYTQPVRAETRQ